MKPTVLIFNMKDRKRRLALEMLLFPLHVSIRYVKTCEYDMPLQELAFTKETSESYTGEELPDEMLVLCGVNDAALQQILYGIRKGPLKSIPHKAVLTPNNGTWCPPELFAELDAEHKALHKKKEN